MKLFAFKDCVSQDYVGFFTCPNVETALRESVAVVKHDKGIKSDPVSFALFEVGSVDAEGNCIRFEELSMSNSNLPVECTYGVKLKYICRLSDAEAKYQEVLNGITA